MNLSFLRKYFIMGSQDCNRDPEKILHEAIEAGITAFQYREKGSGSLKGDKKIELGKKLRQICLDHEIPFIINDNSELIELLNVDGIHVGQDDISVEVLREKHPDLLIGLSISTEAELEKSNLKVVDYIGVGPVYATTSKADAKAVIDMSWIKTLKTLKTRYPELSIVGIGGITEHNAHKVINAGADGVSVISAITKSEDIQNTVKLI